jgi:hypothetical protein
LQKVTAFGSYGDFPGEGGPAFLASLAKP